MPVQVTCTLYSEAFTQELLVAYSEFRLLPNSSSLTFSVFLGHMVMVGFDFVSKDPNVLAVLSGDSKLVDRTFRLIGG